MTHERKHMHARRLEDLNAEHAMRAHDRSDQALDAAQKAALETSTIAIRAMILVNGGAVIALLAFVSAIETSKNDAIQSSELVAPISWFALGVGSAIVTAAMAYVVNYMEVAVIASRIATWKHPYFEDGKSTAIKRRSKTIVHILAVLTAAASLACFGMGVFATTRGIEQLGL